MRQHRTAEDGHDKACGTELRIVAQIVKGDTVDGGEHQRHTAADTHETIESHAVLEDDHSQRQDHGNHGKGCQQSGRLYPAHQPGGNETGTDEQQHRDDVELLRQHLGRLFLHTLGHEHPGTILDNERPAHDLGTHVEELCHHTLTVTFQGEQSSEG